MINLSNIRTHSSCIREMSEKHSLFKRTYERYVPTSITLGIFVDHDNFFEY